MTDINRFREKYGPWAIITGASSGMGEEFAKQLAAKGLNLVLIARRQSLLEKLSKGLTKQYNIETKIVVVDLSEKNFMNAIRAATDGLEIGLLINNAGMPIFGKFLDGDLDTEMRMLTLNTYTPAILAYKFGQQMREQRRGGIIFTASMTGYAATPYHGHYAATKAYVLLLGESMWLECKEDDVDVLVLSPGPTNTRIIQELKDEGKKVPITAKVEDVVSTALKSLGKKPSVLAGIFPKIMVFIFSRLLSRKVATKLNGKLFSHIPSTQ